MTAGGFATGTVAAVRCGARQHRRACGCIGGRGPPIQATPLRPDRGGGFPFGQEGRGSGSDGRFRLRRSCRLRWLRGGQVRRARSSADDDEEVLGSATAGAAPASARSTTQAISDCRVSLPPRRRPCRLMGLARPRAAADEAAVIATTGNATFCSSGSPNCQCPERSGAMAAGRRPGVSLMRASPADALTRPRSALLRSQAEVVVLC